MVPRVPLESPASSELNEEEESPDADYDLDDYDSEEEKRKKKRRPPPKSSKSSGATPARTTRSSDAANDKPFLCTGELDMEYCNNLPPLPPPPPPPPPPKKKKLLILNLFVIICRYRIV